MSNYDDPNTWLEHVKRHGFVTAPQTAIHSEDPDFDEGVAARVAQLCVQHHIVSTLAELSGNGAAMRQTDVFG